MQFQIIIAGGIILLVVLYVYLKRTKGHQESNLPALSEDVNLPAMSQVNPPAIPSQDQSQSIANELDNNRPQ